MLKFINCNVRMTKKHKVLIMNSIELKKLRKEKGLTQEQLAKIIGVSTKTIVNYEKGTVIPNSKREILHNTLIMNNSLSENSFKNDHLPTNELKEINPSHSVIELIEELNERKRIIELLYKNNAKFDHQLVMIGLVETRLKIELGHFNLSTDNIDVYPYYTFFNIKDYINIEDLE